MIPILYEANETEFNHGGIGSFTDAVSAFSIEERNGKFELEMKYPLKGKLFHELKNDRLIKANVSYVLKNQRFKIIRITKPSKGIVTVYAEHVSNLSSDLPLEPEVNYSGSAQSALNTWSRNIVDDHPFTVFSDIQTESSGRWTIDKVENARRALGGVAGSILQAYGGEYRFDNYRISLLAQRGNDNGTTISYGRNLIDLEQEESIDNTYTSIYPYSIINHDDGSEELITLPERFIDSEHVNKFARRKILPVDFSDDEIKSVEELRARTQQYIEQNEIGVPKVNLKVRFIDLARTQEYKDLLEIEQIDLCDWVYIRFSDLDIVKRAKVIKIKWNILLDRYEEIEVGEARSTLSTEINLSADNRINDKLDPVTQRLNIIMTAANGKNKNFYGPDEPTGDLRTGDAWYKSIGDGEFELYIYNGHTWGDPIVTTGVNSEIDQRLEEAKEIAETARDNTHRLMLDADSILAGLGIEGLSETNQNIVNQIKANVGDRIDDLLETKVSEDSIQYQSLIERYDLYERVIGSTEEGVEDKLTRIVQGSEVIRLQVSQEIVRSFNEMPDPIWQRDTTLNVSPGGPSMLTLPEELDNQTEYRLDLSSTTPPDIFTSNLRLLDTSAVDIRYLGEDDGRYRYTVTFTRDNSASGIPDNAFRIWTHDEWLQEVLIQGLWRRSNVIDVNNKIDSLSTTLDLLSGSFALSIKDNDELVAAINASSEGVYIGGKHIVLDADTVVDGSFTVTDTIFAENMSISKFTTGTLNAADVNIINLNVANIVGNTSEFVRSAWSGVDSTVWITAEGITSEEGNHRSSLHAGELNFRHLSRSMRTRINGNGITGYKTGTSNNYERLLDFTDEGMRIQYISGTGTQANTSLILEGAGAASFQYIDFNGGVSSGSQNRARIEHEGRWLRILHPNTGRVIFSNRARGEDSGTVEAYAFVTSSSRDDVLNLVHNRLQTPREGTRDMYLSPNGQGKVRVANTNHDYYPIRASDFENASSRELKTAIEPYRGKALDIINRLNVVEYFMKKDVREGHYNKYVGLISEDSPEVSSQDGKSIMSYAVDAYLIKAVQELTNKVRELESHVNN